jgi:hypothetical protein
LVGITEQSVWNWAPLWIELYAEDRKEQWLSISTGGMAAGLGSGLGMLVAGRIGIKAFYVEAVILVILWLILTVATDVDDLLICSQRRISAQDGEGTSAVIQLAAIIRFPQFLFVSFAYGASNYAMTATQFLWLEVHQMFWPGLFPPTPFMNNIASAIVLAIAFVGGSMGMLFAAMQKFADDISTQGETLIFVLKAFFLSVVGSAITMGSISLRWYVGPNWCPGYLSLFIIWSGTFLVFAGLSATPAALNKLCINCGEPYLCSIPLASSMGVKCNNS